ncbi:FmdB family zinc ribbon protein [Deinococcus sp.]|uniref:FmdB family zinc ribbon protein n=1 Tax=Deinococcus sp. TaxID=47478 RepID=UPI003B5CEBCD
MPTYVYRNLVTNQTFEVKQSMRDDALTQHPETGEPVKRLVSAPGIAFKGSGFYANDSRPSSKASSAGKAEQGGSEKSKDGGSADTASATPAAKSADSASAGSSSSATTSSGESKSKSGPGKSGGAGE